MPTTKRNFEDILAACLADMDAGLTPAQCLARYAEFADQLAPLLQTAARLHVQAWPTLSTGGRVRGRERMHAALAARQVRRGQWRSLLGQIAAAVLILALVGGIWLTWPTRQRQGEAGPTRTASPTASIAIVPTKSMTPTPFGTAEDASVANPATPTATPTVTSTWAASPLATALTTATRAASATSGITATPSSNQGVGPMTPLPPTTTEGPESAWTTTPVAATSRPPTPTESPEPAETKTSVASTTPFVSLVPSSTPWLPSTATHTPEDEASATPKPTVTPNRSPTAGPTATRTPEPEETHTSEPVATFTRSPTPRPTATTAPTATPKPPTATRAPEASATPQPTGTPTVEEEEESTETPEAKPTEDEDHVATGFRRP